MIYRKQYVVLNLFSGRRRYGDIACQMQYINTCPDYEILVLAMDVAVNSVTGNMLNSENTDRWLAYISQGLVICALAGPPCETWSKVRHRWLPDHANHGPVPIRTMDLPWCRKGVETRHYKQLQVGASLLFVAIKFITQLLRYEGMAMLEHPWMPEDHSISTIWR